MLMFGLLFVTSTQDYTGQEELTQYRNFDNIYSTIFSVIIKQTTGTRNAKTTDSHLMPNDHELLLFMEFKKIILDKRTYAYMENLVNVKCFVLSLTMSITGINIDCLVIKLTETDEHGMIGILLISVSQKYRGEGRG